MAGDWIKLEKSTPRKPEVLQLSQILSIHPDHAFGLCVRFWVWCDDQLSSGNAPRVTVSSIDALLERSGIGEALIEVGWLRVRSGSLEIPNFDRHMSQNAKTRALTKERKAKHDAQTRNPPGVTKPSLEKRREELNNTHTARAGPQQKNGLETDPADDAQKAAWDFAADWNLCVAISGKATQPLPRDIMRAFLESWESDVFRPLLYRALDRLRRPLASGNKFTLKFFLQQSNLQDLAEGTHGWLTAGRTEQTGLRGSRPGGGQQGRRVSEGVEQDYAELESRPAKKLTDEPEGG